MYKLLLAGALVTLAAGSPVSPPRYGAPAPYAPAPYAPPPKPYHPVAYKEPAPQPYAYEYGVNDDYSKANFKKAEEQDAYGNVAGSYTIALPDGRIQTVRYTADNEKGFIADVTYEGVPVYPEAPKPYGHPKPYAPAPKPYAPAPKPYVPAPAPYVPAPKPYVPAPAPYVPAPAPYAPAPYAPKPYAG